MVSSESRRLAYLTNLCVMRKKQPSGYQTYACGYFFSYALILSKNPYLWLDTKGSRKNNFTELALIFRLGLVDFKEQKEL